MSDQEPPVETNPTPVVGGGGGVAVPAAIEPIETIIEPIVGLDGGLEVDMVPILPARAAHQDDRPAHP